MKKILFIAHDDLGGGSARSLVDQISILKREYGVCPIVVTWGENSLTKKLRDEEIEVYPLLFDFTSVWTRNRIFHFLKRPLYRFGYNRKAFASLRQNVDFSKVALIVSNSSVVDFGAFLYRETGIPHVWFLREFGDVDFNILPYIKNFPKYIETNSSAIVGVSHAVANHWNCRGINSKIHVIHNGVSIQPCDTKRFTATTNKVRICMSGRLSPAKGQECAVKAMSLLTEKERQVYLLDLWGRGESHRNLENLIKQLKLDDCVLLRGFSNKLNQELVDYDIGFNLSTAEAFGRTTVEYMANSLYVVGCNSGGTPEVLDNGRYGTLVDVNEPKQIANFLRVYLKNVEKYKKIARESQKYALENFSPEKNVEQVIEVYRNCWRDC